MLKQVADYSQVLRLGLELLKLVVRPRLKEPMLFAILVQAIVLAIGQLEFQRLLVTLTVKPAVLFQPGLALTVHS